MLILVTAFSGSIMTEEEKDSSVPEGGNLVETAQKVAWKQGSSRSSRGGKDEVDAVCLGALSGMQQQTPWDYCLFTAYIFMNMLRLKTKNELMRFLTGGGNAPTAGLLKAVGLKENGAKFRLVEASVDCEGHGDSTATDGNGVVQDPEDQPMKKDINVPPSRVGKLITNVLRAAYSNFTSEVTSKAVENLKIAMYRMKGIKAQWLNGLKPNTFGIAYRRLRIFMRIMILFHSVQGRYPCSENEMNTIHGQLEQVSRQEHLVLAFQGAIDCLNNGEELSAEDLDVTRVDPVQTRQRTAAAAGCARKVKYSLTSEEVDIEERLLLLHGDGGDDSANDDVNIKGRGGDTFLLIEPRKRSRTWKKGAVFRARSNKKRKTEKAIRRENKNKKAAPAEVIPTTVNAAEEEQDGNSGNEVVEGTVKSFDWEKYKCPGDLATYYCTYIAIETWPEGSPPNKDKDFLKKLSTGQVSVNAPMPSSVIFLEMDQAPYVYTARLGSKKPHSHVSYDLVADFTGMAMTKYKGMFNFEVNPKTHSVYSPTGEAGEYSYLPHTDALFREIFGNLQWNLEYLVEATEEIYDIGGSGDDRGAQGQAGSNKKRIASENVQGTCMLDGGYGAQNHEHASEAFDKNRNTAKPKLINVPKYGQHDWYRPMGGVISCLQEVADRVCKVGGELPMSDTFRNESFGPDYNEMLGIPADRKQARGEAHSFTLIRLGSVEDLRKKSTRKAEESTTPGQSEKLFNRHCDKLNDNRIGYDQTCVFGGLFVVKEQVYRVACIYYTRNMNGAYVDRSQGYIGRTANFVKEHMQKNNNGLPYEKLNLVFNEDGSSKEYFVRSDDISTTDSRYLCDEMRENGQSGFRLTLRDSTNWWNDVRKNEDKYVQKAGEGGTKENSEESSDDGNTAEDKGNQQGGESEEADTSAEEGIEGNREESGDNGDKEEDEAHQGGGSKEANKMAEELAAEGIFPRHILLKAFMNRMDFVSGLASPLLGVLKKLGVKATEQQTLQLLLIGLYQNSSWNLNCIVAYWLKKRSVEELEGSNLIDLYISDCRFFGLRIEGGKFTRFMCSHVSLPEDRGEQEEQIKLLREILAYCNSRNCEFGQVCLKVQGKPGQTGGLRGVGYMKGLSFLPLAILLGLVKGKAGKAAAVDSFPMNEEKGGNSKYMEYLKKAGATTDRQIQQVYEAIAATVIHTEIVHAENALCESTRTGPNFTIFYEHMTLYDIVHRERRNRRTEVIILAKEYGSTEWKEVSAPTFRN